MSASVSTQGIESAAGVDGGAEVVAPSASVPPADDRALRFIDARGLEKTFSGDGAPVHALRGLDLAVAEGAFLGVMGQSGSGKSTFLSILGGLSHPTGGSIAVDGIDLYGLPGERLADFRREYLGFVFQSFNLVPYLTALENVTLPWPSRRCRASRSAAAPRTCSSASALPGAPGICRASYRAASRSASPSPVPWSTSRR